MNGPIPSASGTTQLVDFIPRAAQTSLNEVDTHAVDPYAADTYAAYIAEWQHTAAAPHAKIMAAAGRAICDGDLGACQRALADKNAPQPLVRAVFSFAAQMGCVHIAEWMVSSLDANLSMLGGTLYRACRHESVAR